MNGLKRVLLALAGAAVLGVSPIAASANGPATDAISGIETGASCAGTACVSNFSGVATGDVPGVWTASVVRTQLSAAGGTITGGSFALATENGPLTGTFNPGGTIAFQGASDSSSCPAKAYFLIKDGLSGTAAGYFTATLTHYNFLFWGACITYFATVSGTVTFS